MDVKYDIHKMIAQYPSRDSYVDEKMAEWDTVNTQPLQNPPKKPVKPEPVFISTNDGLMTLKSISSQCAELLIKPDGLQARWITFNLKELSDFIADILALESSMLELSEWGNKFGTVRKSLDQWHSKRGHAKQILIDEYLAAWDEHCEIEGIEWCSECNQVEIEKDGYCVFCHPENIVTLRSPRIIRTRKKRRYLHPSVLRKLDGALI